MNSDFNTTFMGVDISNPPERVQKALAHYSTRMIDIQEYIRVADFQINPVMFSWFWQVLVDGRGSLFIVRWVI